MYYSNFFFSCYIESYSVNILYTPLYMELGRRAVMRWIAGTSLTLEWRTSRNLYYIEKARGVMKNKDNTVLYYLLHMILLNGNNGGFSDVDVQHDVLFHAWCGAPAVCDAWCHHYCYFYKNKRHFAGSKFCYEIVSFWSAGQLWYLLPS